MKSSENIVLKGVRQHNLKNIDLDIPRDKLVVSLVYLVPGNLLLHLIRFMLRDSVGMWNLYHHTPVNFLD